MTKVYDKMQHTFADECRLALEKSWGRQIPVPKCVQRKNRE